MDIKTNSFKTALTALSIAAASIFSASTSFAATQNEVQIFAADFEGVDDNLYGASYTRYLDSLQGNSGAHLINPYLQRVSSVSGSYANIDGIDSFFLGSTYYFNKEWMLDIGGSHSRSDNDFIDSDNTNINVQVGYNVTREWQIGAGLNYARYNADGQIDDVIIDESYSNTVAAVFTRYTTVGKSGTGWDLLATYAADDVDAITANARYFFSPRLSVGGEFSYSDAPSGFDDSKRASVDVDYWFNEQLSVHASYSKNLDSDIDADVANLRATYRF
ncbi:putative porin [Alteromonas sp. 009811495]|uniref:putative porin n=1 Tax=Alteromonas sp. 009811495 TaxID=3002962 RepID=UPI00237EACB0|nr:putative porin [Alteromonas sp. 009811495]WDT85205.1 putative porin [Alteromonas sp. 009811495]